MTDLDDFGREISDTVRSAVESLPRDLGQTVREAMGDIFDDNGGTGADAEVEERRFEVGPQAELQVSNVSGQISIRGADVTTVAVQAAKRGSRRRIANSRIEIEHVGNRVSVRTRGDQAGRGTVRGNICSVDYEIEVPFACSLALESVSADIVVRQTRADAAMKTVSGEVTIDGVTGNCSLSTVSGDVMATTLDGELQLRTTSGDITIRDSRLQRFNLNSVSGDLTIETPLSTGEYYLAKTVSGDLHIIVPEETGATIQMKSVSGEVSSDLPAEIIKSSRRNWQGRINGGGANVEMNSVSGDLRITTDTDWTAVEPNLVSRSHDIPQPPVQPRPVIERPVPPAPPQDASPAPTDTSDKTSTILQRLAHGEISVEEAMEQLDAVER